MRILMLSRWFAYPPDNGAKIRNYNLIKALARDHQVHLISFAEAEVSQAQIDHLEQYCRVEKIIPYQPFEPGAFDALAGFLAAVPRSIVNTFSPALLEAAQSAARSQGFDAVIGCTIELAPYLLRLDIPIRILEEVEVGLFVERLRAPSRLARWRAGLTWWKLRRYLRQLAGQLSALSVVSDVEKTILSEYLPDGVKLAVIPNGVDCAFYEESYQQPHTVAGRILFPGALTYFPNHEAVSWFLERVFPLIRQESPEAQFLVSGSTKGINLQSIPNHEMAQFLGYLPDLLPTLNSAAVVVVPLHQGGGTRLKILEAMAAGIPVVSTPKGMQGLELVPGKDLLVADDPREFAQKTLALLNSPQLREELRKNALDTVQRMYDWSWSGARLNDLLRECAGAQKDG